MGAEALHWVRHQLAARALARVLAETEREGIALLPVKGFVTARVLYAHPSERPMADVDVRAVPGSLRALVKVARRAGWPLDRSSAQRGTLALRVDGVTIEIETTVGPPFVARVSVAELLRRSDWWTDGDGLRFRAPELHDHAVLLCLNAFKDHLAPPAWAREDLLRIVRRTDFDADVFRARVRAAAVCGPVALVAAWLRAEPAWEALARAAAPASLDARAYARLYAASARARPVLRMLVAQAGADGFGRRIAGVGLGLAGAVAWKTRALRGALIEPTGAP